MAKKQSLLTQLHAPPQLQNTRCNSAPCVPNLTEDTNSSKKNTHSREDSDGSDKLIIRSVGGGSQSGLSSGFDEDLYVICPKHRNDHLRLTSPCGSTASHGSSVREDELELEISRLRKTLEEKVQENLKLKVDRKNMDDEMHELSEALFQEATKMVNEAKKQKELAEKKLKEAEMKIDTLQEEKNGLKKLLYNNEKSIHIPKSPQFSNPKRHIQNEHVTTPTPTSSRSRRATWFQKSNSQNTTPVIQNGHTTLVINLPNHLKNNHYITIFDPKKSKNDWNDLLMWLKNPVFSSSSKFINDCLNYDVKPILSFQNEELTEEVQLSIQNNEFFMEYVPRLANQYENNGQCDLSYQTNKPCSYKFRLAQNSDWYYINIDTRNKITVVCEFFQYLRHLKKGLIKAETEAIFENIQKLRADIAVTRLGFSLLDSQNEGQTPTNDFITMDHL